MIAAVLGLLAGWWVNVAVWRLPRGLSFASRDSPWLACGHPIRFRDRVPVVSWAILRARCRVCRAPIPVRYPLVEAATGGCLAVAAAWVGPTVLLPFALVFAATCITIALIDVEHRRLPNRLTAFTLAVVLVGLVTAAWVEHAWGSFGRAIAGGVLLTMFYAMLAVLNPGGMGWGDVKLAGSLGAVLAWYGWANLVVGGLAAFVLGAAVGLLAVVSGRAGRSSAIPFGPFMVLGTVIGAAFCVRIEQWWANLVVAGLVSTPVV